MPKSKDGRYRVWTFLVYEDSAPCDWRSKLSEMGALWVEAFHDKDLNEDGSQKKPHYHVVLICSAPKSYDQIKSLSDLCSGVNPKYVQNTKGMILYLIHRNNPEKYQYDKSIIKSFGCDEDVENAFKPSSTESRNTLKDIFSFIKETHITEYCDLIDALLENGLDDWYEIAVDRNTLAISQYLKSKHWKEREAHEKRANYK